MYSDRDNLSDLASLSALPTRSGETRNESAIIVFSGGYFDIQNVLQKTLSVKLESIST
jgi:hypothetical protein